MKDHLRFACAYWHSVLMVAAPILLVSQLIYFHGMKNQMLLKEQKIKLDAAFEFITKLGLPYYCFHDVDVVDYTNDVEENDRRLKALQNI